MKRTALFASLLGRPLLGSCAELLFHTGYRGLSAGSRNRWNVWLQPNF